MGNVAIRRYDVLDVTKWICSWMVVVIHTTPLKPYSQIADVITAQGICRIAVPFFFAVSAFLLFHKMGVNQERDTLRINNYCRRIFLIYSIWSVVYFVFLVVLGYEVPTWDLAWVWECIRKFFLEASIYHLWYLLATLYAVPILYYIYTYIYPKHRQGIWGAMWLLWILRCIQYTYNWTGFLQAQLEWLQRNCDAVPNTILCALPLMFVGIEAGKEYELRSNRAWGIRTVVMAFVYGIELCFAYHLSLYKTHFEYLLTAPLLVYNLLCWLLTLNFSLNSKVISRFFRDSSIWIYCVHVLIILAFNRINSSTGMRRFAVVVPLCLVTSCLYAYYIYRKERQKCA